MERHGLLEEVEQIFPSCFLSVYSDLILIEEVNGLTRFVTNNSGR